MEKRWRIKLFPILKVKKKIEKLERAKVGERELTLNLIGTTLTKYLKNLKNLRYIKNRNVYRIDFLGDAIRVVYASGKPYIGYALCFPKGYNNLKIYYTKDLIITTS